MLHTLTKLRPFFISGFGRSLHQTPRGQSVSTNKTLSLPKKEAEAKLETFTEEQLIEQLAKLRGEKPLPPRPPGFQGIWDHTSMIPVASSGKAEVPVDAKAAPAAQLPPKVHGSFSLNGVPIMAPQVNVNENINPATGLPYAQVGPRPKTQISPPPSRNFR
jgi:hypothetical protein